MRNIFIGLLLIFLDFNIYLDSTTIGLIPDFIGYIILIKGLVELAQRSNRFDKARPLATAMAVYTGVLYGMDLIGATSNLGAFSLILGLVSTIISLYISYTIVMGVKDMEVAYSQQLNGDSLLSMWKVLAVLSTAIYILMLFPALGLICLIAGLVVAICFLVAFNTSKNLYYEQNSL